MNDRFTEKARNAIEKARAAAMELGHSYIGTEHLLLGIVRETDALGSRAYELIIRPTKRMRSLPVFPSSDQLR